MAAADTLLKTLGNEISALPTGQYGEVLFDDALFAELPPPDHFLAPDPDVFPGLDQEQIEFVLREHRNLLGLYTPMASPGRILLFERNLRHFFWTLIGRLHHRHPYLTPLDLEGTAQLVVLKTYAHERFHFHCDVLRQLLGGHYDRLHEEALAVAYSRLHIDGLGWGTKVKRMNRVLYHRLTGEAYAYTSPGYRDWPNFADQSRFSAAVLDYLAAPRPVARLQAAGVGNLAELVTGMLDRVTGGCVGEVW